MTRALGFVVLAACAAEPATAVTVQPVTAAVKQERSALIRDSAAQMGVYNAALFGGIAVSETGLAHCWSEATFACMGPASSSCGGEPIIAGSADGPCSAEQGGLGMFQFDSGTYAQTLATYGDDVLTVEGNTAQAVAFVVARVIQDIDGVNDWTAAVAWMNSIPMDAGDPLAQRWGTLMACRYNGCCSASSLCTSRANGYRDNAIDLHGELGAEFWRTADRCTALPAGGVIDQRSECYTAAGEPRFWRREPGGVGDSHETTGTTTDDRPANFARWTVKASGTLVLAASITGGDATTATYQIVHAGTTDTVVIDQTGKAGYVELGTFEFAGTGDEYVELGDNTGVADQRLAFDAIRATTPGGGEPDPTDPGELGSGCSTGGGAGLALGLLALVLRRRRSISE